MSGDRNHDEACELVYVTDGTMINWLREGRLSRIGTVIVDEAHERSTNIDFILGFLKKELHRYPHLRVIVTSATFDVKFYQEFFGGEDVAEVHEVPATKSFGYGFPLFPHLDAVRPGEESLLGSGVNADGSEQQAPVWREGDLPLFDGGDVVPVDLDDRFNEEFIARHWRPEEGDDGPLRGPELTEEDVLNPDDLQEPPEDLWATTRALIPLRHTFDGDPIPLDNWREQMPGLLVKQVVRLARGLDEAGIHGDILGFLPTRRTIEEACREISRELGAPYGLADPDRRGNKPKDENVFPLTASLPADRQREALRKRKKGEARKIVISTNLAETSLTVEGVRFVVDSGLIAQSEWNPKLAKGEIPTKPHSRAGIKQRWGRVGRKAPGWVFPLYTKGQYAGLVQDTPPGSTRDNLEDFVMTATMGGIDNVVDFEWPAAFDPTTTDLDDAGRQSLRTFKAELERADGALKAGGAVNAAGHPTPLGKELQRVRGMNSAASALAVLYADRLACVPEVVTILSLLDDTRLIGPRGLLHSEYAWPNEWRVEAAERHLGLASLCADEAELVLLISAAWERADETTPPWETSTKRRAWCRQWWVNNDVLLEAARVRMEVLGSLSPAMKEDVKRFCDPALLPRARGAITRALVDQVYECSDDLAFLPRRQAARADAAEDPGHAQPIHPPEEDEHGLEDHGLVETYAREDDSERIVPSRPGAYVALRRRDATWSGTEEDRRDNRISNLMMAAPWALDSRNGGGPATGAADAMRLVVEASNHARPNPDAAMPLHLIESWPVGQRMRLESKRTDLGATLERVLDGPIPGFSRPQTEEEIEAEETRKETSSRKRHSKAPRGSKRRSNKKAVDGDDEDRFAGTTDDNSGELSLLRDNPETDEETSEREAFAQSDEEIDRLMTCGRCSQCRSGRERHCSSPIAEPIGEEQDRLGAWLTQARKGIDVSSPLVEGLHDGRSDGWYEVVGYDLRDDGGYAVQVRPDWRPEGFEGDPGHHLKVEPGQPVEVKACGWVQDFRDDYRVFERVDQPGRFLLREAPPSRRKQADWGIAALSLDRGNDTFLEGLLEGSKLTGTVIPAATEGYYTITFLELLHQHLNHGYRDHVVVGDRRRPLHRAVLDSDPNSNGWATAKALVVDETRGIFHRFGINAGADSGDEGESSNGSETEALAEAAFPFATGDPLLLNLNAETFSLEVGGLPIAELKEIEFGSVGRLRLELPDGDTEDDAPDLARVGSRMLFGWRSSGPIMRGTARRLAALNNESAEWQNEVWMFWARCHHLSVDRRNPYQPGTLHDIQQVPATLRLVEGSTTREQDRELLKAFSRVAPEGTIVEGVVNSTTDFGAFVDLVNGLEGLVHISELSWLPLESVADVVAPGERVRAVVVSLEPDKGNVALSLKRLLPDPFQVFTENHDMGDVLSGRVSELADFGAFVYLGEGLEGLAHVSELTYDRHVAHPSEIVSVGETVDVRVIKLDPAKREVGLSIKQVRPDPFDVFAKRHEVGAVVPGRVSDLIDAGGFQGAEIDLGDGVTGSVHISELAHRHVSNPSEVVSVGDNVRVKITQIDPAKRRIRLSIKQTQPHPFDVFAKRHEVGAVVPGRVSDLIDAGGFQGAEIDLGDGVTGSVHISELAHRHVSNPSEVVSVGDNVRVKITQIDPAKRRIRLSIKQTQPHPFDVFAKRHEVGAVVPGRVSDLIDAGGFQGAEIDLGDGVTGSVHISELAHRHVSNPSEVVSVGDNVRVKITQIDPAKRRIRLSIKQTQPHPFDVRAGTSSAAMTRPPRRAAPSAPRTARAEGSTIEEATRLAAKKLGLPPNRVKVTVVQEPRTGLLGLGKRRAVVSVTPK